MRLLETLVCVLGHIGRDSSALPVVREQFRYQLKFLIHGNFEIGCIDGAKAFEALGVDLEAARTLRRRFAYACLDWSERRPHIGGALEVVLAHGERVVIRAGASGDLVRQVVAALRASC